MSDLSAVESETVYVLTALDRSLVSGIVGVAASRLGTVSPRVGEHLSCLADIIRISPVVVIQPDATVTCTDTPAGVVITIEESDTAVMLAGAIN